MSDALTHLDLFSGIGGFALAARRAGFRTIAFSEIEPYACKVLARQFPGIPNLGNVRDRTSFAGLGPVTVVTGGYPCQPFSFAGKRAGAMDDRHLWPAMRDIIATVRPAWVIAENVLGHVTMGLDAVLSDLAGLGYSSQPFVIPACAVDARHLRNRVWIVAYAGSPERQNDRGRSRAGPREDSPREKTGGIGRCGEVLADANERRIRCAGAQGEARHLVRGGEALAHPSGERCGEAGRDSGRPEERPGIGGEDVPDRQQQRLPGEQQAGPEAAPVDRPGHGCDFAEWLPESGICRVANGVPNRAHRLRGLGNAIVPQAVEPFFRWIRQIEESSR